MKQQTDVIQFDIKDLLAIGMSLVALTIGLAYGLDILSDTREDICDYNYDDGECRRCGTSGYETYNSSGNICYNASSGNTTAFTQYQEAEYNATTKGMEGLAKIPSKLPLIVTVVVAAVIIGVLVRYLWVRNA